MNIPEFYSESIDIWKKILGKDLHYHIGWGEGDIFYNAIECLYQFIGENKKVLDCGCGWGSPANIIHIEKQCEVTCITNSTDQVEFINKYHKHLNVLKKDLNKFKPHKKYDTGIFIESFSHIDDKNTDILLKNLSEKVNSLLFMVHVSRKDPFYLQEWENVF